MDPEKNSLNCIFPTKYVIPKSWKSLAIGQVGFCKNDVFWDTDFFFEPLQEPKLQRVLNFMSKKGTSI